MRGVLFFVLLAFFPATFGQHEGFETKSVPLAFVAEAPGEHALSPNEDLPAEAPPFLVHIGPPEFRPDDQVVVHSGFSLLYDEDHEQAAWVAYELSSDKTQKNFGRTDKFLSDPLVLTGTSTHSDYRGSGFDRGHLAPAADMAWEANAMAESFYYSNISPQKPGFNRGIWKKMESQTRTWAIEHGRVYIVTGPVLSPGLPSIGANKVSVPSFFYKVILDYEMPGIRGIGFIFPNEGSKKPLQDFAVTIDSVERLTRINFFPLLDEAQEQLIEAALCVACWSWEGNN
ncbi:MAG TPA: DNA/RNA non-specific endonuclease [Cyclobacteriaceae bacterium]|nr:DNA/RNA non-specific endonuclease [Cyclobacteriaceae bacterium]